MLNSPDVTDNPLFAVKCALTSDALGPVYVITPEEESYVNEPSPPASTAKSAAFAALSARATV